MTTNLVKPDIVELLPAVIPDQDTGLWKTSPEDLCSLTTGMYEVVQVHYERAIGGGMAQHIRVGVGVLCDVLSWQLVSPPRDTTRTRTYTFYLCPRNTGIYSDTCYPTFIPPDKALPYTSYILAVRPILPGSPTFKNVADVMRTRYHNIYVKEIVGHE